MLRGKDHLPIIIFQRQALDVKLPNFHSGGKGGPRKGGGSREAEKPNSPSEAEKPRSRIPRAKPRSREAEFPERSREAEKPNSPSEAEKPRSRIPRAKPRSQECGHVRACFRTYFAHVRTCPVTAHIAHMSKRLM